VRPDAVITDAVPFDDLGVPCLAVIKGDALCHAVACASILAKVERDRMLRELDREHPVYGLAEHKGYGAPAHLEILRSIGPSPVHRLTFGRVLPRRGCRLPEAA
jgi:ribonuclease HII